MAVDGTELEGINEELYREGTSDGLPVVPPTEERLAEMLRGTDLPADHEIGRLGNREGSLTVQTLAINAIMAGCNPTHMPVLVAGARALADPRSNAIQVSVSTGSWAYLWIVNGPIRDEIGIGHRGGAFGPGYRANHVIGRALGLAYKNTALIHPGEKDMGVMGNPAKYTLLAGENEEASPWEPLHVTEGFDAEDSTITFGGPNGFYQYTNHRDAAATDVLVEMIQNMPTAMIARERESYLAWIAHALAPKNAHVLAEAGLSKADVKEYLCENATIGGGNQTLEFISRHDSNVIGGGPDTLVPEYLRSQIADPELLKLPVIGGSARENVVIGPALGGPVTKQLEYPSEWDILLDEYAPPDPGAGQSPGHEWIEEFRN